MISGQRAADWLESASDWANAILIKETRQALKSRQFVITFLLLLIASWLVSVFGMLFAGDAVEYGSAGTAFFSLYYTVLSVATLIIVPFSAYRSLLAEREHNTYELLSITSLKPRQIVWGKLLSAVVQVLIYYSAIAPFIAFTSLLQGFDFPKVLYLLTVSFLASVAFSMLALMTSTMSGQRQWQAINSLAILGGLLFLFFSALSLSATVFAAALPFDDRNFWWMNGIVLVGGITYFILCQQITTAQLTFASDNRSTALRVTCAVQFLLLWSGLALILAVEGTSSFTQEPLMVLVTLCAIHLAICGLFMTTESDFLSRRIRRRLPRANWLRVLVSPLMPGGVRGFLYIALQVGLLWLIVVAFLAIVSPPTVGVATHSAPPISVAPGGTAIVPPAAAATARVMSGSEFLRGVLQGTPETWKLPMQFVTAACCYLLFYTGLATLMGRMLRALSTDVRPAHVRILTILVVVAGIIIPYIPYVVGNVRWRGYSLLQITNPFVTIYELIQREGEGGIVNPIGSMRLLFQEHSDIPDFWRRTEQVWRSLHQIGDAGIITILAFGALLMLLLNVRAIFDSVRQIVRADAVPLSRKEIRRMANQQVETAPPLKEPDPVAAN